MNFEDPTSKLPQLAELQGSKVFDSSRETVKAIADSIELARLTCRLCVHVAHEATGPGKSLFSSDHE